MVCVLQISLTNSAEVGQLFSAIVRTNITNANPVCNIPVDSPKVPDETGRPSPAWLRPVRRRASRSPSNSHSSASPAANLAAYNSSTADNDADIMSAQPDLLNGSGDGNGGQGMIPADLEALFNTSDYMDLSALAGSPNPIDQGQGQNQQGQTQGFGSTSQQMTPRASMSGGRSMSYTTTMSMSPTTTTATFGHNVTLGSLMDTPGGGMGSFSDPSDNVSNHNSNSMDNNINSNSHNDFSFDYGMMNGFGGEMLATEGMDTVSDGMRGRDGNQGL